MAVRIADAYRIDQSEYQDLDTFDELSGMNADRVYRAMEKAGQSERASLPDCCCKGISPW